MSKSDDSNIPPDPDASDLFSAPVGRVSCGTRVAISNTELKLTGMIEDGNFEIRGIFDIHTAILIDPKSPRRTVTIIPENDLRGSVTLMKSLPETWFSETEKPLLGVDHSVSQTVSVRRVCSYFERQLEVKGNDD